jgi:hypothetical protein
MAVMINAMKACILPTRIRTRRKAKAATVSQRRVVPSVIIFELFYPKMIQGNRRGKSDVLNAAFPPRSY